MRAWRCERGDGALEASKPGMKTCHWTRNVNERDRIIFPFIRSGAGEGNVSGHVVPKSAPRQIYGDLFPSMWESHLVPAFEKAGMKAWEDDRHYVESASGKRWVMYDPKGFKDKMRRIRWDRPAPTIVAHLAPEAGRWGTTCRRTSQGRARQKSAARHRRRPRSNRAP